MTEWIIESVTEWQNEKMIAWLILAPRKRTDVCGECYTWDMVVSKSHAKGLNEIREEIEAILPAYFDTFDEHLKSLTVLGKRDLPQEP